MRDSAIFYRSFYEAIKELPPQNQSEVYTAVFEYALNFKTVELSGISKTIFTLIKPQIDANIKRFKNGSKAKTKQRISKSEANNNNKVNDNNNINNNLNDNNNVNETENEKEMSHPLQLFVKSLSEVSKIKTQLNYDNCLTLYQNYGEELVKEVLLAMENTKGLTNKYTSVYLTVNNWARLRKASVRITDPGAAQLKRPFVPITADQL